jgi:NAD(P)-dependent dehydrogenase (short-subunit alcohol dehydrogenase family)
MGASTGPEIALSGRVAIVTGASRGIGAAIARRLAKDGLKVALVARSRDAIDSLARELDGIAVTADVTAKGASEAILQEVEARLGPVSVLVPNAGVEASYKLAATTDEAWDTVMATNATSVFRLCRAAVPGMVGRGYGRVVVVASTAALVGYAYTAAYCASKHAVVGLVKAIAMEIAQSQVTINAVCPGFVDTPMTDRSVARIVEKTGRDATAAKEALAKTSPQHRLFAPDEIAHLVASLLPAGARGIHGQAIAISGGGIHG